MSALGQKRTFGMNEKERRTVSPVAGLGDDCLPHLVRIGGCKAADHSAEAKEPMIFFVR
jgi:hypothetical protein